VSTLQQYPARTRQLSGGSVAREMSGGLTSAAPCRDRHAVCAKPAAFAVPQHRRCLPLAPDLPLSPTGCVPAASRKTQRPMLLLAPLDPLPILPVAAIPAALPFSLRATVRSAFYPSVRLDLPCTLTFFCSYAPSPQSLRHLCPPHSSHREITCHHGSRVQQGAE
jgi:hypothetical protein